MQYDEGTMHQHRSGRRQRSMPDQFGEKTEVTCDAEIESSPNYLVSRSADITQGKVCQYEDDSERPCVKLLELMAKLTMVIRFHLLR